MNLFEKIYREYADDVYRFSFWLSGDSDIAKDISSEAFIKIWHIRENLRLNTVRSLLLVTARNIFLQGQRRKKRLVKLSEEMPVRGPSLEEDIINRDELSRVLQILEQFQETDRCALILKSELNQSYKSISQILDISEVAAKVKVHRVRKELKKRIKEN